MAWRLSLPLNLTARGHMATRSRRSIAQGIALLITALLLSACVSTRTADVATTGQERVVQLHKVTTGLLVGPCGPVPGRDVESDWIQLTGDGPVYPLSEVSFVDDRGNATPASKQLHGAVRIDSAHHTIIVDIRDDVGPMPYSGTYHYKGDM